MGRVLFYHLTLSPLDVTLPLLLDKSLKAGFQVDLRGPTRDRMEWLDQALWRGPDDGFLPHGLDGGPHDALQPILLTTAPGTRAGTACLMAIDGADVAPDESKELDRVCILFDGHDPMAVDRARDQWRSLTGAGCEAEYWSQESGQWACKMSTKKD